MLYPSYSKSSTTVSNPDRDVKSKVTLVEVVDPRPCYQAIEFLCFSFFPFFFCLKSLKYCLFLLICPLTLFRLYRDVTHIKNIQQLKCEEIATKQ